MTQPGRPVRFGRFEADLRTGELRKDGVRIHLQERPFQLLRILIERPGELVTREELQRTLWSPDTFVDFDNGLNTAVTKLREVLGDTAEDHRFIETLPRRGYRFVAPVIKSDEPATSESTPATPEPAPAMRGRGRLVAALVAVSILGIALVLTFGSFLGSAPPPVAAKPARLVVLPFQNLTGDPAQEFLSDGLTEELIARLGRLDAAALGVIARTSAMAYKQTKKRVDEIGRELDVEYLVEGSLQRAGDEMRITTQLIRVRDQVPIWSDSYDRRTGGLLAIQQEIVTAIANAVQIRLSSGAAAAKMQPALASDVDPAAYELYLKGRHLWNQRTIPAVRAARDYFQRAVDLQPTVALFHAGLADAYTILGSSRDIPTAESHPKARAEALKAIELDESLAEGHAGLAAVVAFFHWEWALAERHFKRALELNPNYATAHHWYSEFLMCLGRFDEGIREAEMARRLDPLSPVTNAVVGINLVRARRYDQAVTEVTGMQKKFPDSGHFHLTLGLALAHQGKPREALAEFERLRSLTGDTPDALGLIGYAHGLAKDVSRAHDALRRLDRLSTEKYVPGFHRALIYVGLRDLDNAFRWLERAMEEREWLLAFARIDPLFDPLRQDARFDRLVARIGLPR